MNTKHTPGPWHFEAGREYAMIGANRQTVFLIGDDRRLIPMGSDALLIAAAPDLLAALIELERVESSPHSETTRYLAREAAREAIAKAQGKPVTR